MSDLPHDPIPLTPEQRAILFESLNDGMSIYALQVRCLVQPFRPDVFEQAWARVVARHEMLRVRFRWTGVPAPYQEFLPAVPAHVPTVSVRGGSPHRLRSVAMRLFDEQFERPLDLERDRAVIPYAVHDGETAYVCWTSHHIVLDGISSRIMLRDLSEEYDRLLTGEPGPPRPEAGSFSAFVRWRQESEPPAPASPDVPLPDRTGWLVRALGGTPAPAEQRRIIRPFADDLMRRVRETARETGVTVATMVHAAWALAVGGRTGEDRVRFGVVGYGRPHQVPGSAETIGNFVATSPLLMPAAAGEPAGRWLESVQDALVRTWSTGRRTALDADSILVVSHFPPIEHFTGDRSGCRVEILDVADHAPHPIVAAAMIGDPALLLLHVNGVRLPAGQAESLADDFLRHLDVLASARIDVLASARITEGPTNYATA
ncbi:condensation domain-containing protein [Actinoplanes couchii]|uniref:Condensation domain-containing protein n=1 Tax=Actinoplanes couchii TaxID=403638 RepID=A0ABQ3XTQ1_9ACTN|nr:condensation domain-containing protein [Actinoplanes couchii]MDR6324144.1 hypothetical protein [Actinoplanes couchii]GID61762.1 hypothetical protein Aco03nite_101660 [Actinoplanes couchii]